jgi:hypothetical protein
VVIEGQADDNLDVIHKYKNYRPVYLSFSQSVSGVGSLMPSQVIIMTATSVQAEWMDVVFDIFRGLL